MTIQHMTMSLNEGEEYQFVISKKFADALKALIPLFESNLWICECMKGLLKDWEVNPDNSKEFFLTVCEACLPSAWLLVTLTKSVQSLETDGYRMRWMKIYGILDEEKENGNKLHYSWVKISHPKLADVDLDSLIPELKTYA
jgi:hypothetical protein